MAFLTGQSLRVLKSWYTGGGPEQGFRRCFADGLNQSLVLSAAQATRNTDANAMPMRVIAVEFVYSFKTIRNL